MISISILVNGTTYNVAAGTTLDQLLATVLDASDSDTYASAVNGGYVARQARASHVLEDHDEVTTFEPITGG
jgi:sulfur carrier protein